MTEPPDLSASRTLPGRESEQTLQLLQRAREGDGDALNVLMGRYMPRLQRWASGRLPSWARDLADTNDVVQDTVLRSLNHLGEFEVRREGSLQAYLREAVLNRIKDEVRRANRRPPVGELDTQHPGSEPSPMEEAIGQEMTDRYEKALGQLRPDDREAIIARVELGGSYEDVAIALDKPTVGAARMAVARALVRLAEAMRDAPPDSREPQS